MQERPKGYIPAAGVDWLLPLYDPLLRFVMREERFKGRLVREARIEPGHHVLDLGCGTATLTILVKRLHPRAEVYGLDGDPKALAVAQRKADRARVKITLDLGLAYDLPYAGESFDRVISSLVFHHLTRDEKKRTFADVLRVLRPGGTLHIVDFGRPGSALEGALAKLIHRGPHIRDNVAGLLPQFFDEAGFRDTAELGRQRTVAGSFSFYRGTKPAAT